MPTASEPRIVVRVGSEDHAKLQTAADVAGVGISTLLRECALRGERFRAVARELAGNPSEPEPTMAPPPAAPVPPAASSFRFRCPATGCEKTFGSPLAVCPSHGRRAVVI